MDWNLDVLYKDFDESFQNDENKIKNLLKNILEKPSPNSPSAWLEIIKEYEKLASLNRKANSYANLRIAIESDLGSGLKAADRLAQNQAPMTKFLVSLQRSLKDTDIDKLIEEEKALEEYRFFLERLKDNEKYLLTDAEEELFSLLNQSGANAFEQLKEMTTAKMLIDFEIDGEIKKLTLPALRNLAYDKNSNIRKKAYDAELAAYKAVEDTVAASLNAIKGQSLTMAKRRGFESPLAKTIYDSRMIPEILESLWTAIDDTKLVFEKYLIHKSKLLGHENGLPFYDLFAPIGESNMEFTYEEASEFVIDKFNNYSKELGDYARRAIEGKWVDVEPKEGKRGGAFCSNLHSVGESRIMLNFTGSFDNLSTLAHELGHGWHGHILAPESILNAGYPMPLAETASTFCELLVAEAAMENSNEKDLSAILESSISGITQTCIDIRSRFIFEDEVFKNRQNGPLTVDEINQLMIDAQKEAYGKGLNHDYLHKYMWINKPHYYISGLDYYNFPYAFGHLLALGLLEQYRKDPNAFKENYDEMLRLTGQADTKTVGESMNIDLTKKDFFVNSLKAFEKQVNKWIELNPIL